MSVSASLYDVIVRQQVYLEGVKNYAAGNFAIVQQTLNTQLRQLLSDTKYSELGSLAKSELNALIAKLREIQAKAYNAYIQDTLDFLQTFMKVDVTVFQSLFSEVTGVSVAKADEQNDHNSLYGLLAALGSNDGNSRLWSIIKNAPLPATGAFLLSQLQSFSNGSAFSIENLIRKAYANSWTSDDLLAAIFGTKSLNFNDGQLTKIRNANNAIAGTLVQHVNSIAGAAIKSVYAERYRWVSILDSRTTDICISRANKIYSFATGPLPPAHYNCRSTIEPLIVGIKTKEPDETFAIWIRQQPDTVQNDLLGASRASQMRDGALKEAEPKYEGTAALSPAQFLAKLELMLT